MSRPVTLERTREGRVVRWDRTPRWASIGGGLDSWAMLLDAERRGVLPDGAIFADVGDVMGEDPGEWPSTYRHLRDVVIPWCDERGIEFVWLTTTMSPIRGQRSLYRYFAVKSLMPGRQSRLCTSAAKVERIAEYLEGRYIDGPIEVWIGFEAGEDKRAANDPHGAAKGSDCRRVNRFPLIERGLCRCRCEALARESGYPVPRKSACMYCPFSTRGDFQTLQRELPERFAQLEALEDGARLTKAGHRITFGVRSRQGKATPVRLAEYVEDSPGRPYRRQVKACDVCGAPERATKATGCSYLGGAS